MEGTDERTGEGDRLLTGEEELGSNRRLINEVACRLGLNINC